MIEQRENFAMQLRKRGYHTITTQQEAPGVLMRPTDLIILMTATYEETENLLKKSSHHAKPILIWCEGAFPARDAELLTRQYVQIKGILSGERFPKTEEDLLVSLRRAMHFLF